MSYIKNQAIARIGASNAGNVTVHRSNVPLTNDVIARYAPSVLADEAHSSRGERYSFIPTVQVLDGLRANGFQPYEVRQTRVRDYSRREFTKHLVRLRHSDAANFGGGVPEIVLLNSHDGTSSYQLLAGLFRFICSNGLIAGDICDDIRIRHSGRVVENVIEGSYRVLDNIKQLGEHIEEYKAIELDWGEQEVLANAALELRYDRDANGNLQSPIRGQQLLTPRHYEDRSGANGRRDLWRTFNVIQENLVKGDLSGRSASGRRTRTREVSGVNENVKLNRALWSLANNYAKLKHGEVGSVVEALAA